MRGREWPPRGYAGLWLPAIRSAGPVASRQEIDTSKVLQDAPAQTSDSSATSQDRAELCRCHARSRRAGLAAGRTSLAREVDRATLVRMPSRAAAFRVRDGLCR